MKTKYDIHGALYINKSGNLVDLNNKPVALNCYFIEDPLIKESTLSREHFETLQKEQNIEAIHLTINATGENGYCSAAEETRKTIRIMIDKAVRVATELELYIIIKWHMRDAEGCEANHPSTDVQPAFSDQEICFDFFHRTAKRYHAYGNVLYEIQEPTEMTICASEIIPIIRKYDSYAVILHHVTDATVAPLKGYNIGYAPFLYANELHVQNNLEIQN